MYGDGHRTISLPNRNENAPVFLVTGLGSGPGHQFPILAVVDRDGLRDTVELTELRDLKLLGAVSDGLGGWLVYAQVGDHDFNTKTIEFRISPSLQADASYFATTAQYANFDILGDTYTAISAFTEEQDGVAFAITRRSTGSYLDRKSVV